METTRFGRRYWLALVVVCGCAESHDIPETTGDADVVDAADDGTVGDVFDDAAEAEVSPCRAGQVECSGTCVDPTSDPAHCGACGRACAAGEVCNEGRCASSCTGGRTNCYGACVDLAVDPLHCGSCDTPCARNEECLAGACRCVPACTGRECGPDGCGGSCAPGCAAGWSCSADGRCACAGTACGAICCAAGDVCGPGGGCCTPACAGRACGDDGCGGSCGSCPTGQVCLAGGTCCTPNCGSRECGPDDCGGSCGACPTRFRCGTAGECVVESACAGPAAPSPTAFGFDYAVPGYVGAWYGTDWTAAEPGFRRDLEVLSALRATVVRIMVLPYFAGIRLEEGRGNVGDPAAFAAAAANLPGILRAFRDRGIAVIVALGPNALYWNGPAGDTRRWWEWAYGSAGWSAFVEDLTTWAREFVEAIESGDACDAVLYWDLQNEVDYRVAGMSALNRALLSRVPVPDAKRGMSVLRQTDAAALAADVAATGRPLTWVDIHSYPDRSHNPDLAAALAALRAPFPAARTLVGEIGGIWCENGQDEDRQRDTVVDLLDQAAAASAAAVLHWMLWDYAPGATCDGSDAERIGFGFTPDEPRDVIGPVTERRSRLAGGDFETSTGGWAGGGTGTAFEVVRGGPAEGFGGAPVNRYYLRLTITGAGTYWFCSPAFPVPPGRLAVTGYVRSSAARVYLDVNYHDARGWNWETGRPGLSVGLDIPAGWLPHHVQQLTGGHAFALPSGVDQAIVCFNTTTTGAGPTYIDIDAIGANVY